MFTWICPQCGREVPPSYTECPDCSRKAAEQPPEQQAAPPPPPPYPPQYPPQPQPPQYAPPYGPPQPQQPPPYSTTPPAHPQYQQPQYAPPPSYQQPYGPPQPRSGLPTWVMALLFSVGICAVVFGIYWLVGSRGNTSATKLTPAVENPAAKAGGKTNPYQKFIEIAGVRFIEDSKKKTQVRFVLINHSGADISGLSGNVTVWGRTRNSEEDAEGSFTFTTDLKGYETKDITVPLNTKKKIYELPDWQNVSTDIQITAPE